jgi:hypothetical protein
LSRDAPFASAFQVAGETSAKDSMTRTIEVALFWVGMARL